MAKQALRPKSPTALQVTSARRIRPSFVDDELLFL
jgi:hypothetical protein